MKKEIISIQVLRGFAAIAIVFIHMNGIIRQYGSSHKYLFASTEIANAGVDVFFVISGVIMAIITARMKGGDTGALSFLLRRATRIYPIYWIYLGLFVIGNLLIQGSIMETSGHLTPMSVLLSAFLIPNQDLPILIIGWTLEFEIYFYLLITLLIAVKRHIEIKYLYAGSIFLVLAGTFFQADLAIWSLATDPLLIEFSMGFFIGSLYLKRPDLNPTPFLVIAAALVLLEIFGLSAAEVFDMYGTRFGRLTRFGLPAVFIVTGFLFANPFFRKYSPPILESIGNASYSLYLSHLLILSIIGKLWAILGLARYLPDLMFAVILLAGCLLWASISYQYMELPMIRLSRRLLHRWQ
ncbi:MAG: acyltransferase [Candidatus Marinimicrobia bacterium]|nr:acyltransferase [Candidatus Neomarinimicrobiota bacterium]MCF7851554.1 acyltransferase [Candidatus Neomarinimicrobiota bacterium]MCF7905271.1 acyltransferase [Candidatus Neomarinimicrobiota bacterium]